MYISIHVRSILTGTCAKPSVSYNQYATSSHEQIGDINTFAQFEEGNLAGNEPNAAENESIPPSIEESSTYDDHDEESIILKSFEDIWDGNHEHTCINARHD